MSRSPDVTVCVRPSALLTPALFLLLTDTPILLAALLPAALLHELAHYAVLRLCGVRAARFTLTGLGASLYVPELHRLSYGAELLSAAAGPLMNLLLWVLLSLTGREELTLFAGAQMVLGVLNLLPVRPMDGGRILWLATAYLTEPYTADRVAAAVGLAASSALLALCLWLVLTTGSGLFLLLGALWLAYRSLPPEVFLPRRLAKPTKNR
jgi:stage IV sporulation protein FB